MMVTFWLIFSLIQFGTSQIHLNDDDTNSSSALEDDSSLIQSSTNQISESEISASLEPSTPITTETPVPTPFINPNKIFVCNDKDSCKKGNDYENFTKIEQFSLLNNFLLNNFDKEEGEELEIVIYGSSRSTNPILELNSIDMKRISFEGLKKQQYVKLNHHNEKNINITTEIFSEDVTFIVNEDEQKANVYFNWAILKESPIEVENLTVYDLISDLESLAKVKNTISASQVEIENDDINHVTAGFNFITVSTEKHLKDDSPSSLTINKIEDLSFQVSLLLENDHNKLFLSAVPSESNLIMDSLYIDFKGDDDHDSVSVEFDESWSKVTNIDSVVLNHETEKLYIYSKDESFISKINVVGTGDVYRNDKKDGSSTDPTPESKKSNNLMSALILVAALLVLALLITGGFIIYKKKCKKPEFDNKYNEYLYNSEELEPMEPI